MRTADKADELESEVKQTISVPTLSSLYSHVIFSLLGYKETDVRSFRTSRYTDTSELSEVHLYGPKQHLLDRVEQLKEVLQDDTLNQTKFETFKINYIVDDNIPQDTIYAELLETEEVIKFKLEEQPIEPQ